MAERTEQEREQEKERDKKLNELLDGLVRGKTPEEILGEERGRVRPARAGTVTPQIHGEHAIAPPGEHRRQFVPGAVVGHDAVDEDGETVPRSPLLCVQAHPSAFVDVGAVAVAGWVARVWRAGA